MKIVALDFETANSSSASACSLGVCVFEEGVILDSFEWYIKPHPRYANFTNTFIHHITYRDVKDCPYFVEYYEQLKEILKDALIIAHNARFDLSVLNAICDLYGLDHFHNRYLDTVTFARKFYPFLPNHKLNTISEYLQLEFEHHNAKSDAYCCMMIVLKVMEATGNFDIEALAEWAGMFIKRNL